MAADKKEEVRSNEECTVRIVENDEERFYVQEEDYRNQISALEEEQITLREAWSEIVRTNMATVDDLKQQLIEAQYEKEEAQSEYDALLNDHEKVHNNLATELAATKVHVAQLSQERDDMHTKLVSLLRTIPSSSSTTAQTMTTSTTNSFSPQQTNSSSHHLTGTSS
uniref:Uncharacterized protein n=1 Tax=Aureoumbra lagunensis TaxID=44058 RepID=A0A7S3K0D3_9STRA